jgi:hypothetical protein
MAALAVKDYWIDYLQTEVIRFLSARGRFWVGKSVTKDWHHAAAFDLDGRIEDRNSELAGVARIVSRHRFARSRLLCAYRFATALSESVTKTQSRHEKPSPSL